MSRRLVVIFAVVGIVLLYLISILSEPEYAKLSDIEKYEGKEIVVEGVVIGKHETTSGNTLIKLSADNTTVSVFVMDFIDVEVGDRIKTTGTVKRYKNEYEVVVSGSERVEVMEKWDEECVELNHLASEPQAYEGKNVNVTGYASHVGYHEFWLTDNATRGYILKVLIRKPVPRPINGAQVYVKGKFVYNTQSFEYSIQVDLPIHEVGSLE